MQSINDFLDYNLDLVYRSIDFSELLRNYQQIQNYTNKYTLGSPAYKYSENFDKYFPAPNYSTENINTLDIQDYIYYKSIKQHGVFTSGSWHPDICSFTPEGVATISYSPWVKEPLNQGYVTNNRVARVTNTYSNRQYPLRGASGPLSNVDRFFTSFWVFISNPTDDASSGALRFAIKKSFFMACQHFDNNGMPLDVNVYTSPNLITAYSSYVFFPQTINMYEALSSVGFTFDSQDDDYYYVILNIDTPIPAGNDAWCFLFCAGSDYIPNVNTTTSGLLDSSIYEFRFSSLKYISDVPVPVISFPRSYSTSVVRKIITDSANYSGLNGISEGELVLVSNPDNTFYNGFYTATTGSWLNLTDYLGSNFTFLKSQSESFTGSPLLAHTNGSIFDAQEPQFNVMSFYSENTNPYWAIQNNANGQITSRISFTGSIASNFNINTYNYDINESNSIGNSDIDDSKNGINIEFDHIYFIPTEAALGRCPTRTINIGDIINIGGKFSVSKDEKIYLYQSPADFAIAKVLYVSGTTNISAQIIIKEIYGSFDSNEIIIFNSGYLTGNLKTTHNNLFLLENYQKQLLNGMDELKNLPIRIFDLRDQIIRTAVYQDNLTFDEIKALAINPYLFKLAAINHGYNIDYSQFTTFDLMAFIKSVAQIGVDGYKVSPEMNYLSLDDEYDKNIYEYIKQISSTKNINVMVTNAVGNDDISMGEFETNYLSTESVYGENSTNFDPAAVYFTGPNAITRNTSNINKINIQDTFGYPYVISESMFNFDTLNNIKVNQSSFVNRGSELGQANRYKSDQWVSMFTGPYYNGIIGSDTVLLHGNLDNWTKNVTSSETKFPIYQHSGPESNLAELIFSGQTVFIPIPATNFNGTLCGVEVYARSLGNLAANGFLRASIVDLTNFYSSNDQNNIILLTESEKVTINYISTDYQPIVFTFKDSPKYKDRINFGQNLYIAIDKIGDFRPGQIVFKCANIRNSNTYYNISGSYNIYANSSISTNLQSSTGSYIYNLLYFNSAPLFINSNVSYPNTFGFKYICYPYFANNTAVSYNANSDYIGVRLINSVGATGPGNIPLNDALGSFSYSTTPPQSFTGPTQTFMFGTTGSAYPKGYHLLFAATKTLNDNYPSALIGLERDFIYNSLLIPETYFYISSDKLAGQKNNNKYDSVFITDVKDTVENYNPLLSRDDFVSETRKQSVITPMVFSTGSVLFGGLKSGKEIDMIFKNSINQSYQRYYIPSTPGMTMVTLKGSPNGISDDCSDLDTIFTKPLNQSSFNNTSTTGSQLLNTNFFINAFTNSSMTLKVTSTSGSLIKITNLTTSAFTGPGSGPSLIFSENLSTGSYNNYLITIFSDVVENHGKIEYLSGSYKLFNIYSPMFTSGSSTKYVLHPNGLPLVDFYVNDTIDNRPSKIFKRYVR